MAKLVSTTYGDALFGLALEEDRLDDFHEEVSFVDRVFAENTDLARILVHPKVTKKEKLTLITDIFSGRVSEETVGFLRLIISKDRTKEIPAICAHFIHCVREQKGIGSARVTSAVPLSLRQKKALNDKLIAGSRYDRFDVEYLVDPALLGGLRIRVGDRIVDSSLKTRLDGLTRELSRRSGPDSRQDPGKGQKI